ncbi:unnamed protein product [Trichogramma brassicae]|uniref:Ion transport domain-containing protein n=1 Tax=Trichogramma brassicae TaxID=86971 RepID=A0A6H5IF64_9HYME|nr:unnamed protein product [Trichogramma brassicae]
MGSCMDDQRRYYNDDPERTTGDRRNVRSNDNQDDRKERSGAFDKLKPSNWRDAQFKNSSVDRPSRATFKNVGSYRELSQIRGRDGGMDHHRGFRDGSRDRERDGRFGSQKERWSNLRNASREPPPSTTVGQAAPVATAPEPARTRPKLALLRRTQPIVASNLPIASTPSSNESPAKLKVPAVNIFGGAKPVNTAAREREIEERLAEARAKEVESEKSKKGAGAGTGGAAAPRSGPREGAWDRRNGKWTGAMFLTISTTTTIRTPAHRPMLINVSTTTGPRGESMRLQRPAPPAAAVAPCITLFVMFIEVLIVLVRQSSHYRVTRALRPIFLIDTKYCGNVRRFVRQILQTLPPILDMLGLLLFFMTTYMVLGYYLFYEINRNFATLQDSFVSLFVLLTTANFPDVMMESFSLSKWYGIYFVSYICTMLYVMMNLMLAVVNETFTSAERDKFKKLFLHKRKACQHAFKLLVSKQTPDQMLFKQFEGLMRYYAPQKNVLDVVLMFRYLNTSGSGYLTSDEFLNIYDATVLKWDLHYTSIPWYKMVWKPMQILCQSAHTIVNWPYYESLVYTIIVGNAVAMITRLIEPETDREKSAHLFAASWDTFVFGGLFAAEALTKVLGLGVRGYLNSGWNLFDLSTSMMVLVSACVLTFFPSAVLFVVFRPLRTLRLFKMKKRYRDVFGTLVILTPLMLSTAIVMLVLYYFFAIIGMELFSGHDMRNCCKNTTVEDFYKYSINETTSLGYYYLNTFDNLLASGMTLFELTVVNNWFILMNAYAITVGTYTRAYFMIFYLVTMIVLTIVVSSFLEAFRFRIQYKRSTTKRDEEKMLHEEVELKHTELQSMIGDYNLLERTREFLPAGSDAVFIGTRPRTREVLQRRMYIHEIIEWLSEARSQEGTTITNINYEYDDDSITEMDSAILNGVTFTERRPSAVFESATICTDTIVYAGRPAVHYLLAVVGVSRHLTKSFKIEGRQRCSIGVWRLKSSPLNEGCSQADGEGSRTTSTRADRLRAHLAYTECRQAQAAKCRCRRRCERCARVAKSHGTPHGRTLAPALQQFLSTLNGC